MFLNNSIHLILLNGIATAVNYLKENDNHTRADAKLWLWQTVLDRRTEERELVH